MEAIRARRPSKWGSGRKLPCDALVHCSNRVSRDSNSRLARKVLSSAQGATGSMVVTLVPPAIPEVKRDTHLRSRGDDKY